MHSNIHILLGIRSDATWADVTQAYADMMNALDAADDCCKDGMMERLREARARVSESYEYVKEPAVRECYEAAYAERPTVDRAYCRPKLGQLLVAAGLLTLEELDAVLEIQCNTGNEHVPLGELLLAAGYIDRQQLDYYLKQQRLFKLPPDNPQRWGQRLVELNLVTEDQLKVALIEQRTTGCSLREALINRGWLSPKVLDRIF
jgi:hypothetical protein